MSWQTDDAERWRKYYRKWKLAHRDHTRIWSENYRKRNREKIRIYNTAYQARRRAKLKERDMNEVVCIAKCIHCKTERAIRSGEIPKGDMPFCTCGNVMVAIRAETRRKVTGK